VPLKRGYVVERVERFPEPAFGRLARSLLRAAPADALGGARRGFQPSRPMRFAAFAGDALIGATVGWQDAPDRFYMALSIVAPAHRRRGVYTRLVEAVIAAARKSGFAEIASRHRPDNAAVLIAKLRLGFVVTGYETSAVFGDLVKLTLPLTAARRRALAKR
jgi:GNAT superfamily N-acetyltransferase